MNTLIYLVDGVRMDGLSSELSLALPDSVNLFSGGGTKLAITRDGRAILAVGVRNGVKGLYLRRIDEPVSQFVRGTESGTGIYNASPRFSPDGEWIAFITDDRLLKRVPVSGGTAQTMADSVGGNVDWGDGDRLLYQRGAELWIASADGRDGRPLLTPDTARGIYRYMWPHMLPGGTHALVTLDRSRVGGGASGASGQNSSRPTAEPAVPGASGE